MSTLYEASQLLKYSIENGILITTVRDSHRGIGKSQVLLKEADNRNCTLVVANEYLYKDIQQHVERLNLDVDVRYFNSRNIDGSRLKNRKFLVDEGVSTEVTMRLIQNGNTLLGGFKKL